MERQTKHRILGILVVIGLVIILLPLFQSNQELATEAALVKAPPFPDQPVQVSAAIPDPESSNSIQASQTQSLPQTSENTYPNQPEDVIAVTHPSVINNTQTADSTTDNAHAQPVSALSTNSSENQPVANKIIQAPATHSEKDSVQIQLSHNDMVQSEMTANKRKLSDAPAITNSDPIKTSNYRIIEGEKAASILKKSARIHKISHNAKAQPSATIKTPMKTMINTAATKTQVDDDGLINLKSSVWVIQIGSFKNKTNALRVVNQLRANGYRAFIQQISTALGDNTRVFVGPEHKRTSARALADRLQSEMHIEGIVISYKPLTL